MIANDGRVGLNALPCFFWGLKPHGPGGGAKVLRHAPEEGMGNRVWEKT